MATTMKNITKNDIAKKIIEIVPAIDLLGGVVVRLFQGDFDQVTEYVQDPLELAQGYLASGAQRLHVVDLDGAKTGDPINLPIIESMASLGFEIQAGGGIRDLDRLQALLNAGVSRAVVFGAKNRVLTGTVTAAEG